MMKAEVEGGRWGDDSKIAFSPFHTVWFGSLQNNCSTFSVGLCTVHFLALNLIALRIKCTPG
jgi:hypothetical protein